MVKTLHNLILFYLICRNIGYTYKFIRCSIIEVRQITAARTVVVIIDRWHIESLLAIPAVEILLLTICEDPEAILESTKVGTHCGRMNVARIVGIKKPFTALFAVVLHQKEAAWLLGVLQDAKMALAPVVLTMLEMDGAGLRDTHDVKAQTVVDEQLGIQP